VPCDSGQLHAAAPIIKCSVKQEIHLHFNPIFYATYEIRLASYWQV
jgi:hypothetical protein